MVRSTSSRVSNQEALQWLILRDAAKRPLPTFTNNLGDWMREQNRAYQQDERLNG